MGTQHPYLDRPLEIQIEKWAEEHGLYIERETPECTIKEPNVSAAIVAILREYLQARKIVVKPA